MIEPSQIAADNEGFVDITGTYVQQSMLPGATTPVYEQLRQRRVRGQNPLSTSDDN